MLKFQIESAKYAEKRFRYFPSTTIFKVSEIACILTRVKVALVWAFVYLFTIERYSRILMPAELHDRVRLLMEMFLRVTMQRGYCRASAQAECWIFKRT